MFNSFNKITLFLKAILFNKNILDITKYQNPIQAKFQLHDLIIRLAGDQHYYCLKNLENAEMIADFINETINVKN